MRRPRIKQIRGDGFYHIVGRIGGRRFLLEGEPEKKSLLGAIRAAAGFAGIDLYAYAIMSNHFHLLARVPQPREVSDRELNNRLLLLYGPGKFRKVLEKWADWKTRGQEGRVAEERARMRARLSDLSQFCKTFKETFARDYNRTNENTGTIWEGRFKSVLLEGDWRTLMTVAAYIHLNPVRAGIVSLPEEFAWTSYGAGCAGDGIARAGLRAMVARAYRTEGATWTQARDACAQSMEGVLPEGLGKVTPSGTATARVENGREDVIETDDRGRPVSAGSLRALLRCRAPEFLDGGALGSAAFLKRVAPARTRLKSESLFDRCTFLPFRAARAPKGV